MMFMRRTKIVCTIGPKTESLDALRKLARAGMNVARLNFSHGNYDEQGKKIENLKELNKGLSNPVAILLDTKGPEIRTGDLEKDICLKKGDKFTFTVKDTVDEVMGTTLSYKHIIHDIKAGDMIYVDDAMLEFNVKDISGHKIICRVQNDGLLCSRKGVNVPGIDINLPSLTEKDIEDINFGILHDVDYIAVSFVRNKNDVLKLRKFLSEMGATMRIISKIEHIHAVHDFESILEVSDGIMIARGDLGIQMPFEELPMIQKDIIEKCNSVSKPVITATHMLNSMVNNPRPTRAEVTDVANAILTGTDAVMLSQETAKGEYPIESVKVMDKICRATEIKMDSRISTKVSKKSMTDIVGQAVALISENIKADAILTFTQTGRTASALSKYRVKSLIYAMTPEDKVLRTTALTWGVSAHKISAGYKSTDVMINEGIESLKEKGVLKSGNVVIITAGVPLGVSGGTNLSEVRKVS
ncbi:MAG: pyruvate kinase [Candidatus Nanohalarchaeota archaeon]|nr:MAG: pyruvate kinase [Candidatus Nanohaloarchaeota archaeon]